MEYLSQLIGLKVYDAQGDLLGQLSDVSISTDEPFPPIKRLRIKPLDADSKKQAYSLSWAKYVERYDEGGVYLQGKLPQQKATYLQDAELYLGKDLLDKLAIDTQAKRLIHVKDVLIHPGSTPRILGVENAGLRRRKRFSPFESFSETAADAPSRRSIKEICTWNYLDLIEYDLSNLALCPTHRRLTDLHPADLTEILEELEGEQRKLVIERLGLNIAADAVIEMEEAQQAELIAELPDTTASDLIEYMDPDDAADLINELPHEKADKILRLMNTQEEEAIRKLLNYSDDCAGGLMTNEFVALPETMSAAEAIERLRRLDEDHESVHYLYTCDEDEILSGVLSLRTLLLAPPEQPLKELAFQEVISANVEDSKDEVYAAIAKYDLVALPVVDENHQLVGIVTVDDALDAADEQDEKTERTWKQRTYLLGGLCCVLIIIILMLLIKIGLM